MTEDYPTHYLFIGRLSTYKPMLLVFYLSLLIRFNFFYLVWQFYLVGYEYNRWWCLGILFICYFSTLQSCRIHLLPFLFSSPLQLPLPLSISSFSSLLSFLFKSYIVPIQLLVSKPRVLVVPTTKQSITKKKKNCSNSRNSVTVCKPYN